MNNTSVETIPQILLSRATSTPDKTAYIFLHDGEEQVEIISYKALHNAACVIASQLLKNHTRGERALMLFPPGTDFIRALYGCFYAGIIAVPAYAPRKNRSLERIRSLVADCGATIVLTVAEIHNAFNRSFSHLDELKSMDWILGERRDTTDEKPDLQEASSFVPQLPEPCEVALLQYTSGSTGQPKGVIVLHRNLISNCESMKQVFNLTAESISVSWLPAFHDNGLIDGVLGAIYNGLTSILMPPVTFIQKPVRWLKAIQKYKGTHAGAPNFAFDLCVDCITESDRAMLDLSSLQTLYSGAEPVRKETIERFVKTFTPNSIVRERVYPCYGMAETTLIISGPPSQRGPVYLGVSASALENNFIKTTDLTPDDTRYFVGVGKAWLDTEIVIADPDTLEPVNTNRVGEIWVSGSIVTAGYWNNETLTAQVYNAHIKNTGDKGPFLRTGDLGFFYEGELYITGRLKDLIIIQGKNYYPQDIEYLAEQSHPAIRPTAVAAFSAEVENTERLVIVAEVERTYIRNLNVDEISNAIRQSVVAETEQEVYAVLLIRTASIPKTSSGKIQRKACKKGFLDKTLDVVGESIATISLPTETFVSPADMSETDALAGIQAWLIAWVHIKLKVAFEHIDIHKSISSYGLNSLKAVQLQQDFLDKYKVNIPPYLLFDKLSLKELSTKAYNMMKEASIA